MNKQFLIPGYGIIDQKKQDEQWLVLGFGIIDEETAVTGGSTFKPAWALGPESLIGGPVFA